MNEIVIVGASLAGVATARALRVAGYDGRLTIVGDEPHAPYDRPPLSKGFLLGDARIEDLGLVDADEELAVAWRTGARATALDAATRTLTLDDGTTLSADGIVLATGAAALRLPGGNGREGVHVLRTLDDALALRDALRAARRAVVIGSGFIGCEVAATARQLGVDVTLVGLEETPLAVALGTEMGAAVGALHGDHGVRFHQAPVAGFDGAARAEAVVLADGRRLEADVVVVGIGARPAVAWLEGSGLTVDDGVVCDADGFTGAPGIVAVGDCARWHDVRRGRPHRHEHWTSATEQAAIAAATLLGSEPARGLRAPYFWSDLFDTRLQVAGWPEEADRVTVEEGSPEERSFLALYRRGEEVVGVLALDHGRSFTRWRRQLDRLTIDRPLEVRA
jgi:NADPH-dependent 2,4-dienoyl-CoA reductase/sulfur reductase-like enzyme